MSKSHVWHIFFTFTTLKFEDNKGRFEIFDFQFQGQKFTQPNQNKLSYLTPSFSKLIDPELANKISLLKLFLGYLGYRRRGGSLLVCPIGT